MQFDYRIGSALLTILLLAAVAYLIAGPDGFGVAALIGVLLLSLLIECISYGYLFNTLLKLEAGQLVIHRRVGRTTAIPLRTLTGFRINAHRDNVFRNYREMNLRHADGYTRINVSDLQDEDACIRTLEARLGGRGTPLLDEVDTLDRSFLQKQLDRLLG